MLQVGKVTSASVFQEDQYFLFKYYFPLQGKIQLAVPVKQFLSTKLEYLWPN